MTHEPDIAAFPGGSSASAMALISTRRRPAAAGGGGRGRECRYRPLSRCGRCGEQAARGLTTLGIVIGVAAVVTMSAVGGGAERSIAEQIASLGSNL